MEWEWEVVVGIGTGGVAIEKLGRKGKDERIRMSSLMGLLLSISEEVGNSPLLFIRHSHGPSLTVIQILVIPSKKVRSNMHREV